ncbi:hypothetical protein CPC735_031420 [Coccidioides posadasii C735 delta SOWgp]|uniref:DEAD box helicase n=1 Tax=Coccidioides posadasii (strain C735) TaxID=222929 RepID=C5P516_COCP7|nr:hypothetical protein CPC735_031420 [Coccidioides posadasii C735 delta SOWgp]EER27806.1 hypothetical protein CPC735_031420 [Coccidioides posadasii C735 delta SOWgp]|eukprot:XP_003069951.1 hypothetical protein CPC735_031420 [Coccidioides posadasii C735 delta SOWgp]
MASRHFGLPHRGETPTNEPPSVPLNRSIGEYVKAASHVVEVGSWTGKTEVPSSGEILGIDADINPGDAVFLLPNQINGPWHSREMYLKAHYELLREDAVAPLRDAVAYVRQDPRMQDTLDICIYEKVRIVGITCAQSGIAIRVQFSIARAGKNIVWEYSQRLTTGKIVALTPAYDNFKSRCVVAVVAARPLEGLKSHPCQIDLFFANPDHAAFDYQQEWLMVESRNGYYEALRHTLLALQKMSKESFPLHEYICDLKHDVEPPEYVKRNPVIDASPLFPLSNGVSHINMLREWPNPPKGLDTSQWGALQHILTKRLSVVQGPPGTGKTHVSVVAIRTLLSNIGPNDPPIIIAAQTNHALDQLLRHVSTFERNYVRVGGRSMDLEIRKRTVYELRKKYNIPFIPGGALGPARKQYRLLSDKVAELIQPFTLERSGMPLQAALFLKLELITQSQHDSLLRGAEGWIHSGDEIDPVSAWLGEQMIKYDPTYKMENFGFVEDEIDLEYEQLKELEAEQGLDDDDYENLRGHYIALKEGFTGRTNLMLAGKTVSNQYLKYDDMWKIPARARGNVYSILQKRAKEIISEKLRSLMKEYKTTASNLKIGKWERDLIILRDARVIGMTTTGLSKYRALVSSLKPRIILVEEAAEVIEAPVAAACVESLEHLILVGDHKQLQGQCALKELEGDPFYLNISMFERLVHNGVEFKCLAKQRRMAPEIRRILTPIYDNLEDHEDVLNRPGVPGMGNVSSYFFCHSWPESSDSLLSKYNESEAKMVVGFYLYLYMNGIPAEDITVLTFYNGQRKKILKALKEVPLLQGQYSKVVTVDSYQGEENEIVLLSLVRSGGRNIGFLSIENRVCVALSRAKRGFYIFGNAEALSIHNGLWWEIVQIMRKEPKRLGYYIPVTCAGHDKKTLVRDPDTWKKLDGGCLSPCGASLDCGHKCPLRCHAFPHKAVKCERPCLKLLPCGHECKWKCFRPCECDCGIAHRSAIQPRVPQYPKNAAPLTSAEQMASVQHYRDFANGGAKEADAQLALQTSRLAVNEKLRLADEQAYASLFGEVTTDVSTTGNPLMERVADTGGTSRFRVVQFYSAAPTQVNGGSMKEEPSLLDL